MADRLVYVSRITRLPLVGADGADVGRVVDVVLGSGGRPPRVNGSTNQSSDSDSFMRRRKA